GGRRWRSMGVGLGRKRVLSLAIDLQTPATLYAVHERGRQLASRQRGSRAGTVCMDVSDRPADASDRLHRHGRWHLQEHRWGQSWTLMSASPKQVFALALDPQTPATLYAGTLFSGVFKSIDGGGSWQP